MPRKLVLIFVLLSAPAFAQVSVGGGIGGFSGYKLPYVEGIIQARHQADHYALLGEFRAASGRKADTGDGFHLAGRAGAGYRKDKLTVGGGISGARQFTSLYQKGFVQPFAYVGYDAGENGRYEGYYLDKGTDSRNGQRTIEGRVTFPLKGHWSLMLIGQVTHGYETDQPKQTRWLGGAMGYLLYTFGGNQ